MAKVSKQAVFQLARNPAFFESLRYQFGSYKEAAKATKIPAKTLEKFANPKNVFAPLKVSDKQFEILHNGLSRLRPVEFTTGKQFIEARGMMTPAQLRATEHYTAANAQERAYFRKAVRDYVTGKTERVRMATMDVKGNVIKFGRISPKAKKTSRRRPNARERAINRRIDAQENARELKALRRIVKSRKQQDKMIKTATKKQLTNIKNAQKATRTKIGKPNTTKLATARKVAKKSAIRRVGRGSNRR